jgi:hypothetical protein
VLTLVFSSEALTAFGIVGFCAFALRHRRAALYLSPIAALAAITPLAGHRFAMYLGPLVGMGIGFVVDLALRRMAHPRAAALLTSVVVFAAVVRFTPAGMTPSGPYLDAATHRALLEVGRRTEDDALILAWWDYGYAVQHVAGRPTVLDGGAPGLPRTARVARALTGHDPAELARVLEELSDGRPTYVLLTADLAEKYPSLAAVAGRPPRRDAESVFDRMFFTQEDPASFDEVLHVPGVARLWRLNRP